MFEHITRNAQFIFLISTILSLQIIFSITRDENVIPRPLMRESMAVSTFPATRDFWKFDQAQDQMLSFDILMHHWYYVQRTCTWILMKLLASGNFRSTVLKHNEREYLHKHVTNVMQRVRVSISNITKTLYCSNSFASDARDFLQIRFLARQHLIKACCYLVWWRKTALGKV